MPSGIRGYRVTMTEPAAASQSSEHPRRAALVYNPIKVDAAALRATVVRLSAEAGLG